MVELFNKYKNFNKYYSEVVTFWNKLRTLQLVNDPTFCTNEGIDYNFPINRTTLDAQYFFGSLRGGS